MKTKLPFVIVAIVAIMACSVLRTNAQNTAPYWSLAGNSNANGVSKLGVTGGVGLRIFTSNLERMRISAAGNVGIGIVTPSQKLHVVGNGAFTGNVGIGTTLPAMKLHVKQVVQNRAIEWQHETQTDYWTVGIGTSTLNCRFEFDGIYKAQISSTDGAYFSASDLRLKEGVEPLSPLLDKIMQLKPSRYFFKDSRLVAKNKSLGFIAQDVEKIFPEMVSDIDGGYKGLNYSAFAVLAIKAIQEQQENIREQQKSILDQQETIVSLQDRIDKMEATLAAITGNNNTAEFSGISLQQNSPNPFREATIFRYTIPGGSQAQLKIYDVSGKLVKSMNAPSNGQARISGNELSAGTYIYTLLVNGKPAASKKMELLK